jgi:hypothetical protein
MAAQDKFKAVTNETPKSVVDSMLKPTAELHLLIGGPYTLNGEEHRYGHTALRVKTAASDKTYDFGRYGNITGTFHDAGEGILRVWSNFSFYIESENILNRMTTDFVYFVFDSQADSVTAEFTRMIKAGKPRSDLGKGRKALQVYELSRAYSALSNNCTTISVDAIKFGIPRIDEGSGKFINPESVMTWAERAAMNSVGGGIPQRIFLPANLQEYLSSKPAIRANRIEKHGGR